jgi:hypothetical protein
MIRLRLKQQDLHISELGGGSGGLRAQGSGLRAWGDELGVGSWELGVGSWEL